MGRARFTALVIALAAVSPVARAEGPPVQESWATYERRAEQVQAVQATPVSDPGLLALVNTATGTSRLDVIRPEQDVLNRRQFPYTVIPVAPGQAAMGLDADLNGYHWVSVANVTGTGPSRQAVVLRRHQAWVPTDDGPEWTHMAGFFDISVTMEMPYGLAFNRFRPAHIPGYPPGSMYVTDARLGQIVEIRDAGIPGNPSPGAVQVVLDDPALDPGGDGVPVLQAITGEYVLGATGIVACPIGGTYLCPDAGDLLVVNTSTGVLYGIEVGPTGHLSAPRYMLAFSAAESVTALQFGPGPRYDLFYASSPLTAEFSGGRVWRISQGASETAAFIGWPVTGCPVSDASDVAVRAEAVYVSSRNAPGAENEDCPAPGIVRVEADTLEL